MRCNRATGQASISIRLPRLSRNEALSSTASGNDAGCEMKMAWSVLRRLFRDERGATMVEYGLMIALIAIAVFATVVYFGTSLQALFERIRDEISAAIQ